MRKIKKMFERDPYFARLLVIMAVVFTVCCLLQPKLFPTSSNFLSIAKQFPEFGILSIGIGLALLTGGIDLSAVSVANLAAILAAIFMKNFAPKGTADGQTAIVVTIGIGIALVVGAIAGAVNGLLISKLGIPPILATLGTQQLYSGIAIVMTEGKPQSGLPSLFFKTGTKTIAGVLPVPLLVFIICAIVVGLILSKTKFGASLYMLGTNPKASRYAGLNNDMLFVRGYLISGVLAAVAGLIMMARTNSAKADFGSTYTLQCVLIAVLGGIDPAGGKGKVRGIVVAVVTLQMLSSCLSMFENVSNFYRDIIWGLLLIMVLISNHYTSIYSAKRKSEEIKPAV